MDTRITGNLGDILLREGLITNAQLKKAEKEHQATHKPLARVLVDLGVISEKVKLGILQKKLGVEIVSLKNFTLDPLLAARIPKAIAVKHSAIPVKMESDGLLIAMEDPSDLDAVDRLSAVAAVQVKTVLAPSSEIDQILETYPQEQDVEEVVPRGKKFLRFIRGTTFWILLLLPIAVFFVLLKYYPPFSNWLREQKLTEFDLAIYLLLLYLTWSVLIYYFHDLFFNIFDPPEEEEEEEES